MTTVPARDVPVAWEALSDISRFRGALLVVEEHPAEWSSATQYTIEKPGDRYGISFS
jgi:hypothetical protein